MRSFCLKIHNERQEKCPIYLENEQLLPCFQNQWKDEVLVVRMYGKTTSSDLTRIRANPKS